MDRLNFYSGQLVTHNDMNTLENYIENKDKELTQKLIGYGIVEGFTVSPNSPLDLTVLVNPGFAIDQYGNTVKLIQQKQVNLAAYVPSSNSRYVLVYAKFVRKEYETKINDIGKEIKYRQDEDCEIAVAVGNVASSPVKPDIPPEGVLLADILLTAGQMQITEIDNARRQNLVALLQHELNTLNPHQVKMSQLADYVLSDDLNANGKKITGLPAASSNTEPVRKQEFDEYLSRYTWKAFPTSRQVIYNTWTEVQNSTITITPARSGNHLVILYGFIFVETGDNQPATWEWNWKICDGNNFDLYIPQVNTVKRANPGETYYIPIIHAQKLNLTANISISRKILIRTMAGQYIRTDFGSLLLLIIPVN